jgi:HlyD family secretion protein
MAVTRRIAWLVIAAVAAAGLVWVSAIGLFDRSLPEGLLQVNGRMEADRIIVASKFPGRVEELLVHEGDQVVAGQLLVRIDDKQTAAQVRQAHSSVAAFQSQASAARHNQVQAERDARRSRELRASGMTTERDAERAELAARVARDQRLTIEAQLNQARSALDEAQTVLSDLSIQAPSAGTVMTRLVDVGEVVTAGAPLLTLVDLDRLYLQVYIPEQEIGRVRLGLPAQVYTDAYPRAPFTAELRYIAAQAEFTPKEIQTKDERIKQVYAARLYLQENPRHRLTPGLPADAIIRWKEDVPWAAPRW